MQGIVESKHFPKNFRNNLANMFINKIQIVAGEC